MELTDQTLPQLFKIFFSRTRLPEPLLQASTAAWLPAVASALGGTFRQRAQPPKLREAWELPRGLRHGETRELNEHDRLYIHGQYPCAALVFAPWELNVRLRDDEARQLAERALLCQHGELAQPAELQPLRVFMHALLFLIQRRKHVRS